MITNALEARWFLDGHHKNCNHKIGILVALHAIGAASIVLTLPAAAQSPSAAQARQWCFGTDKISDDQRLVGCSAVLQANPSNALALANRGETFRRKGEAGRAIADLNRGTAYRERGEADRALADLDMSIKLDPNYGPAYGNSARIFRDWGDRARALADFGKSRRGGRRRGREGDQPRHRRCVRTLRR